MSSPMARFRSPGSLEVEGDWSQAAFFLAMGVEVRGLKADSHQGDRAITRLLAVLADARRRATATKHTGAIFGGTVCDT